MPRNPRAENVAAWLHAMFASGRRPSAAELVRELKEGLGPLALGYLTQVLAEATKPGDAAFNALDRDYARMLLDDDSLEKALHGEVKPDPLIESTIDGLMQRSALYRSTEAFREMVAFMGRFRRYSPYNNMLVRLQNPSCSFYATEKVWITKLKRSVKEDARPMLILAPKHPVMLVYALDDTEGPDPPQHLREFAQFRGRFEPELLKRLLANATGHRIRVDFKPLSSTHGGFATLHQGAAGWKMRIAVHDGLDPPSRFGVLCHELAHVLLGHLGGDPDGWWPARAGLDHRTVEIEAEAVAHIVAERFGLAGSSVGYLSAYTEDGAVPPTVSMDFIAKVAGHLEEMARKDLPPRRPRSRQPAR